MTWSDAAREAALEARRAHSGKGQDSAGAKVSLKQQQQVAQEKMIHHTHMMAYARAGDQTQLEVRQAGAYHERMMNKFTKEHERIRALRGGKP